MSEILPAVYDIAQPTPVTLKQLSAIAVSLQIWRNEVREHRASNTIEAFYPLTMDIFSKSVLLPDLPSVLYDVIDEYVVRFGPSLTPWLFSHHERIFRLHRSHRNFVLKIFDDFVADYNGTIDYVKTAKRMMVCDSLSEAEKFAIACMYFFEDDIRRIWPSVCESFDLNSLHFDQNPTLCYWICCLKNQLDKIPIHEGRSVDEVMFHKRMMFNKRFLQYFWGRVSLENRMTKAMNLQYNDELLLTFVLARLTDQQLVEYVNSKGCDAILRLLNDRLRCYWLFEPTWKLIKNKITETNFRTLVVKLLKLEQDSFAGCQREPKNWLYNCWQIWTSIAPGLRERIAGDIVSNIGLFENIRSFPSNCSRRFVGFLLIILSSITLEQRSTFWRNCWPHLIQGSRSEDLVKMMKLCFENEEKIEQFKVNTFAVSDHVRIISARLLCVGQIEELNDLVNFCYAENEAAKTYKVQLLRSTFLAENSRFTSALVECVNELSVFIDDTFNDNDQSADFKNQLMSSPRAQDVLSSYLCSRRPSFEALMELVDTFVSSEQTVYDIKTRMISFLTEFISNNRNVSYFDQFRSRTPVVSQFLVWLMGASEAERFAQAHLGVN